MDPGRVRQYPADKYGRNVFAQARKVHIRVKVGAKCIICSLPLA